MISYQKNKLKMEKFNGDLPEVGHGLVVIVIEMTGAACVHAIPIH